MNNIKVFSIGKQLLQGISASRLGSKNASCAIKKAEKGVSCFDSFANTTENIGSVAKKAVATKQEKKLNQEIFHAYIQFKRTEFPITKAELDGLLKLDGDELIDSTVNLFMGKMKIPQSLKPTIISSSQNKEVAMSYLPYSHYLNLNPNVEISFSKEEQIGILAHELRHMQQNFDVLRTEGLGEKAVVSYGKKFAKNTINYLSKLVNKGAVDDYKKLTSDPNAIADFERLVALKRTNPKECEKQIIIQKKALENMFFQQIGYLRGNVIKELGELKADSEQGIRAKKYLKSFMTNYYKKDGTVDVGKYSFLVTEREALNLGWAVEEKAKSTDEKFCFMHFIKNYKPRRLNDEARNKEIDKELQEGIKRVEQMDWKEYLRYVYG